MAILGAQDISLPIIIQPTPPQPGDGRWAMASLGLLGPWHSLRLRLWSLILALVNLRSPLLAPPVSLPHTHSHKLEQGTETRILNAGTSRQGSLFPLPLLTHGFILHPSTSKIQVSGFLEDDSSGGQSPATK